MDILACRSEENSYNILPSAATMLFHGLPGGDVRGVVEEMDRRGKSESAAISSAIDMGESETVGETRVLALFGYLAQAAWQPGNMCQRLHSSSSKQSDFTLNSNRRESIHKMFLPPSLIIFHLFVSLKLLSKLLLQA